MQQEYQVRLDLFEGPLDLLLHLVTRAEVEITAISVAAVTRQYLEYLDLMRELDIDVAADYLHMAATLLRLKARELLPRDEQQPPEDVDEYGIYTREQLIQQLLEYKKYKEAAQSLKRFEAQQIGSFARGAGDTADDESADEAPSIGNITVFDLLTAFKNILSRTAEEAPQHVIRFSEPKIDDRIEQVLSMLTEREEVRFEDLFGDDPRRITLVVTFMAILELIRMQEIWFRQEERYGEIFVKRRAEKDREPAVMTSLEENGGERAEMLAAERAPEA